MNTRSASKLLIALCCLIVSPGLGKIWGRQSPSPQGSAFLPVLTHISEIRKLSVRDADLGHPVRIQGVVIYSGGPPAFRLLVRSPNDVMVLERASRWNPQRVLWVLGLMGALMLAGAAWVIILRKQVRSKTQEMREWLRREAGLKERYRDLLENAIDMVYTHDLQGNITSVNNAVVRILGYAQQETLRMNILDVVAPGTQEVGKLVNG